MTERGRAGMGQRDRMFKVLVVGDATVGKTSLVQRYANDSFNRHYKSTVGGEPSRGSWGSRGFSGGPRGPAPLLCPRPTPGSGLGDLGQEQPSIIRGLWGVNSSLSPQGILWLLWGVPSFSHPLE